MIYRINAGHSQNNVYKATIFPHNIGLGATRDPDLVKRIGVVTALEVKATGIPYVFAPCNIAVMCSNRGMRCGGGKVRVLLGPSLIWGNNSDCDDGGGWRKRCGGGGGGGGLASYQKNPTRCRCGSSGW